MSGQLPKTELKYEIQGAISDWILETGIEMTDSVHDNLMKKLFVAISAMPYESLRARVEETLEYCRPNLDQMWAARVAGILLSCDFRDSKKIIDTFEPLPKRKPKSFESWQDWIHEGCNYLCRPGSTCDKCGTLVPLKLDCTHSETVELNKPGVVCLKCGWFVPKEESK